jgi:hypothetical protein
MWLWDQSKGELYRDGAFISSGYSGKGRGKNNPSVQNAVGVGPIPQGDWIIGSTYVSKNTGPVTIVLNPAPNTNTFGRSAFRIHGDSIKNPGTASRGCIILPRYVREKISKSSDRKLRVVE